jgi:cytochrome b561
MPTQRTQFTVLMRLLHWTMAAMVLTMLCIGVAMVASLADYRVLVSIHHPLGIAILILVVVRFVNRRLSRIPPFPATMSRMERLAATASEYTLYGLMFVLPLVGWGMLSAARYPIVLYGPLQLPFILPHNAMLYAVLRKGHTILAYILFLTFLAHFGAILFHTLIVRDGILKRMAPWNIRPQEAASTVYNGLQAGGDNPVNVPCDKLWGADEAVPRAFGIGDDLIPPSRWPIKETNYDANDCRRSG